MVLHFIRNAIRFDYPIVETIRSILPLCDEFIVVVETLKTTFLQVNEISHIQKIKLSRSIWDDSLREGGRVLYAETNKAMDAISADSTWCFLYSGDEILHEVSRSCKRNHWKNGKMIKG